ncbi:2543_t:CDS:10 [Funneliformis geosporum]|uniref:16753_t:CDS:1 n=1 Tax=Funneliformis geosporum TaxID=1117311 RepID=A0A9W4WWE4_9GLOM|nr:2543_t:CDS:10 [Funneliformis geosporum]CAI2177179.1 16753_t:CDS:10 [Funneliformis geosporum]
MTVDNSIVESSSTNAQTLADLSNVNSKYYQKNLINYLRDCLNSLSKAIENYSIFNDTRANEFRKEIERVRNKLKSNRGVEGSSDRSDLLDLNVCLIGNTGSGKSSLINALLNHQVMPTAGSGEACTSFLWRISHNDNASNDSEFTAKIFFKRFEEYQREVKQAFELLSEEEDIDSQILSKKNESEKLLETLFGPGMSYVVIDDNNKEIVFGPNKITKSMAMADKSIQELLKIPIHETTPKRDAKELSKTLKKFLPPKGHDKSSSSASSSIPYWPFIKEIHIQGPFEALRNGVVLIDVPGNCDINENRSQTAKSALDITDHIWIISNIKRAISEESTANILSESLRDQLKMTGKYLSRTFICTHSDIITLDDSDDEIDERSNELNDEREKLEDDIKFIKEDIEELKEGEFEEDTHFDPTKFEFIKDCKNTCDLQVFTVSSTEYMKLKRTMQDTEIPKLVNHLKEISKINISNKINNIIKNINALIESMLRYTNDNILLDTIDKRQQAKTKFNDEKIRLIYEYKNIIGEIMKKFSDEIDKFVLKKIDDIGRIEAENKCITTINRYGRYLHHAIWKATVKRDGYYIDSNGVIHNFNADLIHPIIKSVTNNWFIVFSEIPKSLVELLDTQVNKEITRFFEAIDKTILTISPDKKKYIENFQLEIKDNRELKMNNIKEKILDNNKSMLFDYAINEFKTKIPISIDRLNEYIVGTVLTTLKENLENDYACFWEISKKSNIFLQEKDSFIVDVNKIIDRLKLIQKNLNELILKEKENVETVKGRSKKKRKEVLLER